MTLKITVRMLDKLGAAAHDHRGCASVRDILAQAGVVEPIELHIYEAVEINRLRQAAAELTASADAIEARGPWPESGSVKRWTGAGDAPAE